MSDGDLASLKATMMNIRAQCAGIVSSRRNLAENVRYARWPGQSDDGRKHAEAMGEDVLPFEGASDTRDRLADQLINEFVRLDVAAATRGVISARPVEFNDASNAGKITVLLRWLVKNAWGKDFRRQVKLLSQYRHGDSPAAVIALVDWFEETCLQYVDVRLQDVVMAAQEEGRTPEDAMDLALNPDRAEELAAVIQAMTGCKPKQARKAVKDLQKPPDPDNDGDPEEPVARIAVPYTKPGLPRIVAGRVYQDWFYPENATDLQRTPLFYRYWYTHAEILALAEAEDWDEEFVENVLGAEAQSAFDDYQDYTIVTRNGQVVQPNAGYFEVVQAFYPAADDEGVMGIYTAKISGFSNKTANGRKLWDRKHGKMPVVFFPREVLTRRLNDTRGIPELTITDQNWRKLVSDSVADNVQVTVNPTVMRPAGRAFYRTAIAPFGEVEVSPGREPKFMDPPQYPKIVEYMTRERRRQFCEYWGRLDAETMPDETLSSLAKQDSVDEFLASLSECFALCVQLCQQYMSDEQVQRVVGGSGMQLARSVSEIQGKYDVMLEFDADDLDPEKAMAKTKMILGELSAYDRNGILPVDQIIMHRVAMIFPSLADAMPTPESGTAQAAANEKANVVMILNGSEPPMPEKIDAPQVRLQTFQGEMMVRLTNPNAFPEVTEAARLLAQNRLKYLTQQVTQLKNAQIGRTGAAPVDLGVELQQGQQAGGVA